MEIFYKEILTSKEVETLEKYDYAMLESSYPYNEAMNSINSILKTRYLKIHNLDLIIPYFYLDKKELEKNFIWLGEILKYIIGEKGLEEVKNQLTKKKGITIFNFPLNLNDKKSFKIIEKILETIPYNLSSSIISFIMDTELKDLNFFMSFQEPYTYFDLKADTFQDFLNSLKKNERKKVKKDQNKIKENKVTIKEIRFEDYSSDIKRICLSINIYLTGSI